MRSHFCLTPCLNNNHRGIFLEHLQENSAINVVDKKKECSSPFKYRTKYLAFFGSKIYFISKLNENISRI